MVLLVFLIDTSASMNQKTCLGTTYLDIAKGAVETFLKIRSRDANASRGDRYMLVTLDEPCVKAGWHENLQVFQEELKNLQAVGLSNLGHALRTTFDLLNMHRLQSGIDNYAMGRNPYYLEPAIVLLITDGGLLTSPDGLIKELTLPMDNLLPGGELSKEVYRWDQRLFSLSIKIPGFAACVQESKPTILHPDDMPLSNMCEVTGGKLYSISSHKSLMQSMESIAQKLSVPGVVINFEKVGPDPDPVVEKEENCSNTPGHLTPQSRNETCSPSPLDTEKLQLALQAHQQVNGFVGLPPPPCHGLPYHLPLPPGVMLNGPLLPPPLTNGLPPPPPVVLLPSPNRLLPPPQVLCGVRPPLILTNGPILALPPLSVANGILPPISAPQPASSSALLPTPPGPPLPPTLSAGAPPRPPPLPPCPGGGLFPPPLPPPGARPSHMNNVAIVNPIPIRSVQPPAHSTKSDGQESSLQVIPETPIRGSELAVPPPGYMTGGFVPPPGTFDTSFVPVTTAPPTLWHNTRRMIFVRSNMKGAAAVYWPVPENFCAEDAQGSIPPCDAQPRVKFMCKDTEPMVIDNLPFDKYELEPSPLTQYILERKQPNAAWQAFVSGSSRNSELGYPFGYLKASTNLQCVNFFVLPYNYPVIMPLLDELFKVHRCKPTPKWRQSFEEYLTTMPSYYAGPLRNALRRMNAPNNLVPEHVDGSLSYSVISYLKKIKHQAKLEADRLVHVHSQRKGRRPVALKIPTVPPLVDGKQKDYRKLLIRTRASRYVTPDAGSQDCTKYFEEKSYSELSAFADAGLPNPEKFHAQGYKNPFDVSRRDIVSQVNRMRTNFFHQTSAGSKLHDEDLRHSVPMSQMGNYQEFLMQHKPLREVDPTQGRVHTFGNPFKLKQVQFMVIDEADVAEAIVVPGNRKRLGDPLANKTSKKKRSETPPPSRRPVGPPNTPPPKSELMRLKAVEPVRLAEAPKLAGDLPVVVDVEKAALTNDAKVKPKLEAKDEPMETESSLGKTNARLQDDEIAEVCGGGVKASKVNHMVGGDGGGGGGVKKAKSVNQQLKKLQAISKLNSKMKVNSKTEPVLVNGQTDEHAGDSSVLSILRTSLEDERDETNAELEAINDRHAKTLLQNDRRDVQSPTTIKRSSASPAAAIADRPMSTTDSLRAARLQLQARCNVKLRMLVFREIRNRANFKTIKSLIHRLKRCDRSATLLFIDDIVEECKHFHLTDMCTRLKQFRERLVGAGTPLLER